MVNIRTGLAACGGLLLGMGLPALAQQEVPEIPKLQRIEVTGSNLRRAEIESALPIQIITRDQIAQSGAITAAEIMLDVSANLVGRTDLTFTSAGAGLQPGLASANLRGLGDGATLVLINGRRAANYALSGGAVNLNFIPVDAIDRGETDRQVLADSVEKLLFLSYSKNSTPVEASLLLGRGGPFDPLLRAPKRLLTNAPTIRRTNRQLQRTRARIRGHCNLEFFNRIGRRRTMDNVRGLPWGRGKIQPC